MAIMEIPRGLLIVVFLACTFSGEIFDKAASQTTELVTETNLPTVGQSSTTTQDDGTENQTSSTTQAPTTVGLTSGDSPSVNSTTENPNATSFELLSSANTELEATNFPRQTETLTTEAAEDSSTESPCERRISALEDELNSYKGALAGILVVGSIFVCVMIAAVVTISRRETGLMNELNEKKELLEENNIVASDVESQQQDEE